MTKPKRVAAVQSNYIPWKGYFDLIHAVDEFILYDDVQYTPRNWRNRNRIKTPTGVKWLTVPVSVEHGVDRRDRKIADVRVADHTWPDRHWAALRSNYVHARHFKAYEDVVYDLFMTAKRLDSLSGVNIHFLRGICDILDIHTIIRFSTDFALTQSGKNDRPLELAELAGAEIFITGPTAAHYYEPGKWTSRGIRVKVFSYAGYKEYRQPHPPFRHDVSILDLIFSTGAHAKSNLLTYSSSRATSRPLHPVQPGQDECSPGSRLSRSITPSSEG